MVIKAKSESWQQRERELWAAHESATETERQTRQEFVNDPGDRESWRNSLTELNRTFRKWAAHLDTGG